MFVDRKIPAVNLHKVKTTTSKYESVMQLPNAAFTKAPMNEILLLHYQHYVLLLYLGQDAQRVVVLLFFQSTHVAIIIVPLVA